MTIKKFDEFENINENRFTKVDIQEFEGRKPFIIDEKNGELYLTIESTASKTQVYYLTYEQYSDLKELNGKIIEKCRLIDEQKETTISIMKTAVIKQIKK